MKIKEKGILSFFASITMLVSLMAAVGMSAQAEESTAIAKINETSYVTLAEAAKAAKAGDTITLLADASGDGVIVAENQEIVFDFGGHTYTFKGNMVGSTGTQTNGMQLLKGSKVTLKNGTLKNVDAKMMIQNYGDLTLKDITVEGNEKVQYVVSNNCGNVSFTGETNITATDGNVAFDVYHWAKHYPAGVHVMVDTTGVITGKIEYAHDSTVTDEESAEKASLTLKGGSFDIQLDASAKANIVVTGGTFKDISVVQDYLSKDLPTFKKEDGTVVVNCQHTGGKATCKDKAVCEICGTAYGELDAANHTGKTDVRNAKAATDKEKGYTGDKYCSDCNTLLEKGTVIDVVNPSTGFNGTSILAALLMLAGAAGITAISKAKK